MGRWMCNCRTGYTGDQCQLRAYDEYMMFITDKDYKGTNVLMIQFEFFRNKFKNLTDTGEDSELVRRRIWSKVWTGPSRYLLREFPTRQSDEYDSAPSRKYTAHFGPFSPVSVNP